MGEEYHHRYPSRGRDAVSTGPQPTIPEQLPVATVSAGGVQTSQLSGPPADLDAPITHAQASQILEQLHTLTTSFQTPSPEDWERERQHHLTQGSPLAPALAEDSDKFEESLSTGKRVWKVVKWVGGATVTVTVAIFGLGVGYQKAIGDNATKIDVDKTMEDHRTKDFIPLQQDVAQFKADMIPVQQGVGTLVGDRNKEQEVKKAKRKLKRHEKEHLAALEEYAADKAAHRPAGPRPTKSPAHIDLEDEVEELEDKL